ncbi:MAG TPA: hypothetical protein VN946_04400 [Terriglobales bacterium]|jgi:hypothetical protein|nr:hypothetical protein [Terriglobales bacterium]
MTCMTVVAQPLAMATTQLASVIRSEGPALRQEQKTGNTPRMNWVVVTGKDGNRVLRMQWVVDGSC